MPDLYQFIDTIDAGKQAMVVKRDLNAQAG
jgi:hypothetical protein